MRYITGDECGLIKEHSLFSKSVADDVVSSMEATKQQQQQQRILNTVDDMSRQHGIVRMLQLMNKTEYTADSNLENNSTTTLLNADRNNDSMKTTTTTTTASFAALRKNGSIQFWQYHSSKPKHTTTTAPIQYNHIATIPNVFTGTSNMALNMGYVNEGSTEQQQLVVCSTTGAIAIVDSQHYCNRNGSHDDGTNNIVKTFATTATASSSSTSSDDKKNIKNNNNNSATVAQSSHVLSTFCTNPIHPYVVMGGKNRDMILYDISRTTLTNKDTNPNSNMELLQDLWKAKNLPPHPQTLLQPQVWPTASLFLSDTILAVGTAYQQIRIYDIRVNPAHANIGTSMPQQQQQRRPTMYTNQPIIDYRITALCKLSQPHDIVVGDGGGTVLSLDLRRLTSPTSSSSSSSSTTKTTTTAGGNILSKSAITGRYIGPTGCVNEIIYNEKYNHLVCVGLDRVLRVFHCTTKKQIHEIHCKQRLNCVTTSTILHDNDEDPSDGSGNKNYDDGTGQLLYDENQQDDVQDYNDSDDESLDNENEDDIVNEMMMYENQKTKKASRIDDDDGDDDDDDDDDDDVEDEYDDDDDDDDDDDGIDNEDEDDDDDDNEVNEKLVQHEAKRKRKR